MGGNDNFDAEMRLVDVMQRTRSLYLKYLGAVRLRVAGARPMYRHSHPCVMAQTSVLIEPHKRW